MLFCHISSNPDIQAVGRGGFPSVTGKCHHTIYFVQCGFSQFPPSFLANEEFCP